MHVYSVPFKNEQLQYRYVNRNADYTLLCIPGYMETADVWNILLENLNVSVNTIVVDLPGHGSSVEPCEPYSLIDICNALCALLEREQVKNCIVAGHSMGGYIALRFLTLYGQMLRGVCFFNTHPFADSFAVQQRRKQEISLIERGKKNMLITSFLGNSFFNKSAQQTAVAKLVEQAHLCSNKALIYAQYAMLHRQSTESALKRCSSPVLYIYGDNDAVISASRFEAIQFPENTTIVKLSQCGHISLLEYPEQCALALNLFLERII